MSDDTHNLKRSRKNRRVLYLVLVALFGLPALALLIGYTAMYWRSQAELDAEIEAIRSRGEPLWFADLDPGPDESGYLDADLLAQACEKLEPLSDEFRELLSTNPPAPPGDYREFRAALATNGPALEEIVEIARRSECRFRYEYQTKLPCTILLPHVDQLTPAHRLLCARFLQSLGTGEEARAVAAIVEALDIAELLREDSFIVCQLIRARRAGEALDRLQTFLGQTSVSMEQSVTIDDRLAQMERRFRLAPTICAQRAALFTTLDAVGSEEFAEAVETMFCTLSPNGSVPAVRNAAWKNRWWGSALYRPWLLHERAFALRMLSRYAACVDQTGPAGQRAFDTVENDLVSQLDDVPINRAMFPAVRRVREAGLEHRQRLIAARLGLRVSRYRAELGRLPDSLDQVLDQQIDAVPAGLFSGKPLVYEAESEGFAIYDVNPTSEEPAGRFEVSQARPPEPQ